MDHNTTSDKGTKTLFGLLRHGQTEWNAAKKIQGAKNSPLTILGKEQTALWAKTLAQWSWDRIVASDLGRVRQTVAILNETLRVPVTFDPRLQEQAWGEWEGLSLREIKSCHKAELEKRVAMGWDFEAPGGESRKAVRKRVFAALDELCASCPGDKILIVCHHGVIKTALYEITGRPFMPEEDPLISHNRFHLVSYSEKGYSPLRLNIAREDRR